MTLLPSLTIFIFIYTVSFCTAENVCYNASIFNTNVVENYKDNINKGTVLFTYPAALNGSLQLVYESVNKCKGLQLVGTSIVMSYTKDELLKDCDHPSGECKIMCSDLKGSFFPKRVSSNQRGLTFKQTEFKIDVTENILLGSTVFEFKENDIVRNDCFNPNDRIFSLQNSGKQAFDIEYPGKITLRKELDYEDGDHSFVLNITLNNSNRTATTTVHINVNDVDDMDPAFYNDTYELTVMENINYTTWMTTTPKISAHDRDTGKGQRQILYSYYGSKKPDVFEINSTTGEIRILQVLNREQQDTYNFKIQVYQINDHRRSATANLNIIVTDQNDNKPIFDSHTYQANIDENSSKGTFVTRVHATDKDVGMNAKIIYSIETKQDLFEINPSTGELYVRNSEAVDSEHTTNPFNLTIRATDTENTTFFDKANVAVTILDKNDNSPVFSNSSYFFESSANLTIGQIIAVDADEGENSRVEYSLDSVPDVNIILDRQTGILSSKVAVHDDTNFRVKACDSPKIVASRRCSYAMVYIQAASIQTSNTSMAATVMENMPVGTFVSKVQVNGHKYTIIDNSNNFGISLNSGVISTKTIFDYEDAVKKYTFHIIVQNKDNKIMYRISVTVSVLDVNDNHPEFIKPSYMFAIPDVVASGSVVGTVKALDKDTGDNSLVGYSIQDSLGAQVFQVNKNGQIKASSSDVSRNLYEIYVKATDHGVPSLSSFVRVLVTKVNIINGLVKIGTPLDKEKLQKRKEDFEREISLILKVTAKVENILEENSGSAIQPTRSSMLISGKFANGSAIPAGQLQMMVLDHILEIQALFGNEVKRCAKISPNGMTAAEIALIAVGGVIFVGSILLIFIMRLQWDRALKFDRLQSNLTRKSSLYESQEIKVGLDDETSDYTGSLNTQEIEISQISKNGSPGSTAFANPVYESVHGPYMADSRSTIAATNEALESLQELAERLNKEDRTSGITDIHDFDQHDEDETFPKESEIPRIEATVDNDLDLNTKCNFEIGSIGKTSSTGMSNLMKFDSSPSLFNPNSDNFDHHHADETNEPSIDYNDKQVRFSSTVLDAEDDIFKPLKEEAISPNHFDYNSDVDERDGESLGSSFPDLSTLIRQSESDETDRADEEINSPLDFLNAEEIRHTPRDHGTFHFGFTSSEQNESTKF